MKRTYEFIGVPSGDCECFCWEVDREEFIKVTGRIPDDYMDYVEPRWNEEKEIWENHSDKFRIYPDEFYPVYCFDDNGNSINPDTEEIKKKAKIKIEIEEIED